MKSLMPQGYFDEVQKWMVREGFALVSLVSIDNTECKYHVPCTIARSTSLFFHLRGKSLIVMLRYDESDYWDKDSVEGFWRLDFYIRFKDYSTLLKEHPEWYGASMENSLFHDMPIFGSTKFEISGFQHQRGLSIERDTANEQVGLSFEEERGRQSTCLNARILAFRIKMAVKSLESYLDHQPLYRISMVSFIPHYTFSGENHYPHDTEKLEQAFWSKFDWSYFKHLVIRPYGYNYHRKQQACEWSATEGYPDSNYPRGRS